MTSACGISAGTRRAVAFVAWRLITGHSSTSIYDHAKARRVRFSGTVSLTRIAIRDQDGCEITGSGGSGMYTLTQGQGGKPITLKIDGLRFEGFDYGASRRYQGTIERETLRIREARGDCEFSYSVEPDAPAQLQK